MRAVVLRTHGGPESLTIEDVPDPTAGPEDVVVDVRSTSLNRADLLQVMGMYPEPAPMQRSRYPVWSFPARCIRWVSG